MNTMKCLHCGNANCWHIADKLQQANEEIERFAKRNTLLQRTCDGYGTEMREIKAKLARYEGGVEVDGVFNDFGTSVYLGTNMGYERQRVRVIVMKEEV